MTPAPFITFEGGEGAGKSTQIKRLAEMLEGQGIDVLITREPGGAPGAERIRELILSGEPGVFSDRAETLLHFAARADHLDNTILPARAAGKWVLCDRFVDSTRAYQGYAQGVERELINILNQAVIGSDGPDLTLVLDMPVDAAFERLKSRGGDADRYETLGREFHESVRSGFLEIAENDPGRCVVIDASRDENTVSASIRDVVRDWFEV